MRNLYKKDHYVKIVYRIQKLKPEQVPLMGSQTVGEMICLCAVLVRQANGKQIQKATNSILKQQIMKLFFLRMNLNFPQRLFYLPLQKSGCNTTASQDFEMDKHLLLEQLQLFTALPVENSYPEHWALGKLSRNSWGSLLWKILNFHLKQFNV